MNSLQEARLMIKLSRLHRRLPPVPSSTWPFAELGEADEEALLDRLRREQADNEMVEFFSQAKLSEKDLALF